MDQLPAGSCASGGETAAPSILAGCQWQGDLPTSQATIHPSYPPRFSTTKPPPTSSKAQPILGFLQIFDWIVFSSIYKIPLFPTQIFHHRYQHPHHTISANNNVTPPPHSPLDHSWTARRVWYTAAELCMRRCRR